MESLPSDIVQEILSRVPAESVLECKLVCKKWVTLIRQSNFASMHLSRLLNHLHVGDDGNDSLAAKVESSLIFACLIYDPDDITTLLFLGGQISQKCIYNENMKRIYHPPMHDDRVFDHLVGSCNGLVCAFQLHDTILDPIYICNPLTREYVYLPQLVVKEEDVDSELIEGGEIDMCGRVACGFGYLRSTNEYKVVRIHYPGDEYVEGNVEVYTLGSGCGWRAIGKVSYRLDIISRGTYANDAIYWISGKIVVSFDFADEEFRLLSVPPRMQNPRNSCSSGLVSLGKHLCYYRDDKSRVQIWSLIKSSDSKETWRLEYDINYEDIVSTRRRIIEPICLTENGEIIFLFAGSALYSYDPKTTVLNMISNKASTENFDAVEVIAHVNTLASLETMGESSKRYTVCPRRARTPWDDVLDELDGVAPGEVIDKRRFRLRVGN